MRTKQYYQDAPKTIHSYYVPHAKTPCGCGSNVYHYEYDGKSVHCVCNTLDKDIYILDKDEAQEKLKSGIWK